MTITTVVILGSMSAVSLYWSSVFRRSVAATAVSYASVIALCVVSAPAQIWNWLRGVLSEREPLAGSLEGLG